MHRKCVRRIVGILKKSVSWVLPSEEEGWLSLARWGLVSGAHVVWVRWKSQVYLSPYVEKPLISKVIKSFVPELRSRQVFFVFRDSYVLCKYVYEHFMNIMSISQTWVSISNGLFRWWKEREKTQGLQKKEKKKKTKTRETKCRPPEKRKEKEER